MTIKTVDDLRAMIADLPGETPVGLMNGVGAIGDGIDASTTQVRAIKRFPGSWVATDDEFRLQRYDGRSLGEPFSAFVFVADF